MVIPLYEGKPFSAAALSSLEGGGKKRSSHRRVPELVNVIEVAAKFWLSNA